MNYHTTDSWFFLEESVDFITFLGEVSEEVSCNCLVDAFWNFFLNFFDIMIREIAETEKINLLKKYLNSS